MKRLITFLGAAALVAVSVALLIDIGRKIERAGQIMAERCKGGEK